MKKVLGIIGAFIMVPIILFTFIVAFVSTTVQNLNPMCLASGSLLTPATRLAHALGDVGNMVFGNDGFHLEGEQMENAAIIYQVGKTTTGVTEYDIELAFMTALQESGMRNIGHLGERNDHNSIGLFQQQYGMVVNGVEYWGSAAQLHNPVYASQRFFLELVNKVPDRKNMPKHRAIQTVQRSSYPEAYAKWEDEAEGVYVLLESANQQPELDEDKSIAVIGDSITVMANTYMFDDLAAAGYTDIRIDAQGARSTAIDSSEFWVPTTSQTSPTLTSAEQPLVSGLTAIRNQRAGGFDPRDWMILLGTNDIANISKEPEQGAADARRTIVRIMDELGLEKRVMWLTVWSTSMPEQARIFNRTLAQMTAEWDNLFVGDWASLVEQNPDWLVDPVHYSPEGSKQRSSFLGRAVGLLGKAVDIGSGVKIFSAMSIGGALLDGCNFGSSYFNSQTPTGEAVGSNTPLETVSNPRLAEIAASFEQLVGTEIRYGAPRDDWYKKGRQGNFGHGNKQQWLSQLTLGPGYRTLDCSGFMNMILYFAYQLDYSGCSSTYRNLVLNGQTMTVPVMENRIVASLLQPGDFIIMYDGPCSSGRGINHIVMVLGTSGSMIATAESQAGASDGYEIRQRDVSWFNTNWPDLVVSRWVGPGAIVVESEPVEVGVQ